MKASVLVVLAMLTIGINAAAIGSQTTVWPVNAAAIIVCAACFISAARDIDKERKP